VVSTQLQDPTATVAFADSAEIDYWDYANPTLVGNTFLEPPSYAFPSFHGRHNKQGNIIWADGHAKSKAPTLLTNVDPSAMCVQNLVNDGYTPSEFPAYNLGDIGNPCSSDPDYYFELVKGH